jgi:DNA-binding transcriptional LysR family regulator
MRVMGAPTSFVDGPMRYVHPPLSFVRVGTKLVGDRMKLVDARTSFIRARMKLMGARRKRRVYCNRSADRHRSNARAAARRTLAREVPAIVLSGERGVASAPSSANPAATAYRATGDFELLVGAASSGAGIALLPRANCSDELASGRLVQVLAPWRAPDGIVHLIFTSRRGMLPSVRAVVEFAADALRAATN